MIIEIFFGIWVLSSQDFFSILKILLENKFSKHICIFFSAEECPNRDVNAHFKPYYANCHYCGVSILVQVFHLVTSKAPQGLILVKTNITL